MSEFVFLNDRLVAAEDAHISIYDGGLLHGVGIFETLRSYGGQVYRLEDHLRRLSDSAGELGITITQNLDELPGWIDVLLEANGLGDARLRLTLTRGNIRNADPDNPESSNLFITAGPMTGYPPEYYQKGMTVIVSDFKQNPHDFTLKHKTINYLGRLLALKQAHKKQAGEALWFTVNNLLAEGCVSNIFLILKEKLLTPPLDTPVLAGVTRQAVLELARGNDIECVEKELVIQELLAAKEVLLTNSIMELMPVCRIERHAVGEDKPGPVYKKLHELYKQAVEQECLD